MADNWWEDFGNLPETFAEWGESIQAVFEGSIEAFAVSSWEFLKGSFEVGAFTNGGGGQDWWVSVMGGTISVYQDGVQQYTVTYPGMLNVMVVAMIPILIIFVAFQIGLSLFRASTAGMLRAFATSVLAIPLTYVCAGLIFLGLRGTDQLTMWILEIGEDGTTGDDVGIGAILRLFGLWVNPDKNDGAGGIAVDANSEIWAMGQSGQPGMIVGPFIVAIIMLLACLVLMLMMLFRTVVTLLMAMFTPVAVFSLGTDAAKGIASKWGGMVVALLMAKPVAAAVIKMGVTMMSMSSDFVQMAAGICLVIISAAMPILMLSIISFMTPDSSHSLESSAGRMIGGGVGGGTRRAMRGGQKIGGATWRGGKRMFGGGVKKLAGAKRGR